MPTADHFPGCHKNILQDFAVISGLKCNIEKTNVMLIGPTVPEEAIGIARLGFTIVESLKVLGFRQIN